MWTTRPNYSMWRSSCPWRHRKSFDSWNLYLYCLKTWFSKNINLLSIFMNEPGAARTCHFYPHALEFSAWAISTSVSGILAFLQKLKHIGIRFACAGRARSHWLWRRLTSRYTMRFSSSFSSSACGGVDVRDLQHTCTPAAFGVSFLFYFSLPLLFLPLPSCVHSFIVYYLYLCHVLLIPSISRV